MALNSFNVPVKYIKKHASYTTVNLYACTPPVGPYSTSLKMLIIEVCLKKIAFNFKHCILFIKKAIFLSKL
jgi:hypothetical protein